MPSEALTQQDTTCVSFHKKTPHTRLSVVFSPPKIKLTAIIHCVQSSLQAIITFGTIMNQALNQVITSFVTGCFDGYLGIPALTIATTLYDYANETSAPNTPERQITRRPQPPWAPRKPTGPGYEPSRITSVRRRPVRKRLHFITPPSKLPLAALG